MAGWGSYVRSDNLKRDTVYTGTFLDGVQEGIFVEKEHEINEFSFQDTEVIKIVIREYSEGLGNADRIGSPGSFLRFPIDMRSTSYILDTWKGGFKFQHSCRGNIYDE